MEQALETLGFTKTATFTAMNSDAVASTHWEREGFEGRMECLYHNGAPYMWAHRTAACGAGTGIRPVGTTSVKQMVKHIKAH